MKPIYTLHRAYTQAEYELVEGVRAACHYALRRPDQGIYETHHLMTASTGGRWAKRGQASLGFAADYKGMNASFSLISQTVLFAYAKMVLGVAHERTREKYPDYMDHAWVEGSMVSRNLVFTSPRREAARDYCEQALWEAVADPAICVQEGIVIRPCGAHGHLPEEGPDWDGKPIEIKKGEYRVNLIVNAPEIPPDLDRKIIDWVGRGGEGSPVIFSREPLRFTYDQVATHIVELSPELLELLNAADGRIPLSDLDQRYLDAVGRLEIDRALALIGEGANPNAVDQYGFGAIGILAETSRFDHCPIDEWEKLHESMPDLSQEERIAMMKPLIERGANPDLVGYMGILPLDAAIYRAEYETVKFLLEAGANPNINPYPDIDFDTISLPLDVAYAEASFFACEPDSERVAILDRIADLLVRYGARLKVDQAPKVK